MAWSEVYYLCNADDTVDLIHNVLCVAGIDPNAQAAM